MHFFIGCWQRCLIYGVIKREIQNPSWKNLKLAYDDKIKQEFWTNIKASVLETYEKFVIIPLCILYLNNISENLQYKTIVY